MIEFLLIAVGVVCLGYTLDQRLNRALKEPDVFYQLQHPATEELREIYREIDRDVMITEPDLLTPEAPKKPDTPHRSEVRRFWVNLLFSPDGKQAFKEMRWSRQAIAVEQEGQVYNLISRVEFPKWEHESGFIICGLFDRPEKGTVAYLTTIGSVKPLQRNDVIVLNQVANRTTIKRGTGSFPPAGVPKRPGAGWLDHFTRKELN